MINFRDLSIKRKVLAIILVGVNSAVLVALVSIMIYDLDTAKKRLHEEMLILSRITAIRSAEALEFGNHHEAVENLHHLSISSSIQSACIYDLHYLLFAEYRRVGGGNLACEKTLDFEIFVDSSNRIVIVEPIIRNSNALGHIIVSSSLEPVSDKLKVWLVISALALSLASIISVFVTRRMQKTIINPMLHLTDIMGEVRRYNDLTIRAYRAGKDELGDLVDAFNEMLSIIENGNTELDVVYSELVNKSTEAEAAAVELEARNKQIKGILSGAAHDLRQPLQAMSIFLDMLALTNIDSKQSLLVEKLTQAMNNLSAMFTEILDESRLEHKYGTAELENIDLSIVLPNLYFEFEALALKKSLDLRIRVCDISVCTIPGILDRIIRNLLSNALAYTDSGGVLLSARKRGGGISIEIWDTGRGIPHEKQTAIFHKYEQVEDGERGYGYGLGLAIVRQFVEMLGYTLEVNSVYGRGSCFRISIPIDTLNDHSEPGQPYSPLVDEHSETYKPDSPLPDDYLKVLEGLFKPVVVLVDDEAEIRAGLKLLMESWDLTVLDFEGLDDVVEYFKAVGFTLPSLIVSDYQLAGGVTGDQVIRAIRDVMGEEVPAFVVTGSSSSDIHASIRSGGFEFLKKPVSAKELRKSVSYFLGHS